jgi:hypothetical protein
VELALEEAKKEFAADRVRLTEDAKNWRKQYDQLVNLDQQYKVGARWDGGGVWWGGEEGGGGWVFLLL